MTEPEFAVVHRRLQRRAHLLQQRFKQLQRQQRSGLAISRRAKDQTGQTRQSAAGRIAMQNLHQKQMTGGYRIQDALPPSMFKTLTEINDSGRLQKMRDIRLDPLDDL